MTLSTNRTQRYTDFDGFYSQAISVFIKYFNDDADAKIFDKIYSFYVKPGGRLFGQDKCLVDVFFGQRPYDQKTEIEYESSDGESLPIPRLTKRLASERGAMLRYYRTDFGNVICTLIPASAENHQQKEDSITLEIVDNPEKLTSKSSCHWRYLISYMKCTSLDGDPSILDRLRVNWLRKSREMVVDGKVTKTWIRACIEKTTHFVFNVGLSGCVLAIIMANIPSKKDDVILSAVKDVSSIESEIKLMRGDLNSSYKQIDRLTDNLLGASESIGKKVEEVKAEIGLIHEENLKIKDMVGNKPLTDKR